MCLTVMKFDWISKMKDYVIQEICDDINFFCLLVYNRTTFINLSCSGSDLEDIDNDSDETE